MLHQSTDVYALALTFWSLLSNEGAWSGVPKSEVPEHVIARERPDIPTGRAPPEFTRIIEEGWDNSPEKRPTAAQVCVCVCVFVCVERIVTWVK